MPTNTVLLVKPQHFGFNVETADSNAFQRQLDLAASQITEQALAEFAEVCATLEKNQVNVVTLDSPAAYTPDAVFPNNWFSTHRIENDHYLCVYPMLSKNRQHEVQLEALQATLNQMVPEARYQILDYRGQHQQILEGTGVLIFDHQNQIIYLSLSERADQALAQTLADELQHQLICFHSVDANDKPIYHTNVMMSIGEQLAFVCLAAIKDEHERQLVVDSLTRGGKTIIDLSLTQIYCMAGNVLELENSVDEKLLLLSETANSEFTTAQINVIDKYCRRVPCAIPTIEQVGGGSVRCMLAEIFI